MIFSALRNGEEITFPVKRQTTRKSESMELRDIELDSKESQRRAPSTNDYTAW